MENIKTRSPLFVKRGEKMTDEQKEILRQRRLAREQAWSEKDAEEDRIREEKHRQGIYTCHYCRKDFHVPNKLLEKIRREGVPSWCSRKCVLNTYSRYVSPAINGCFECAFTLKTPSVGSIYDPSTGDFVELRVIALREAGFPDDSTAKCMKTKSCLNPLHLKIPSSFVRIYDKLSYENKTHFKNKVLFMCNEGLANALLSPSKEYLESAECAELSERLINQINEITSYCPEDRK
jgi:hypothetical protein